MGGFQQSILDSLQSAGFQNMAFSQLNQLTPEQIASTFAQQYNLDQEDLPSTMFQPIKQNLLQATNWGTYSPAVEAEGQTKLQGLYKGLGGTGATQAAGGFAGSGGFGKYQGGIKDVYGRILSQPKIYQEGVEVQHWMGGIDNPLHQQILEQLQSLCVNIDHNE